MRTLALAALLALAACHRPQVDQPTPGADGKTQAKTAAKTIADLQAADAASRRPVPVIVPPRAPQISVDRRAAPEPDEPDENVAETNAD